MSVEIVAELSNNWRTASTPAIPGDADRDRLGRLIDAAQAVGADAVKFQCYSPDELVALRGDGPAPDPWGQSGWTMRALYEKARTPFDWFPKIKAHCERVGIPWFSSVFGAESLALLESLGCERYKIAALDNRHSDLLQKVRRCGKPLLVSAVHSDDVRFKPPCAEDGDVSLLYCPRDYPTRVEDVHLPMFVEGDCDEWSPWLGLSSHCLAPELPIAAVARGAKLIEMHMQLDAEPSELEANVSLGETAFATMVRSVRATERLLA